MLTVLVPGPSGAAQSAAQAAARIAIAPAPLLAAATDLGYDGEGLEAHVQAFIAQERQKARASKDWPRSDRIRTLVSQAGYAIEDTPQGQRWRKA